MKNVHFVFIKLPMFLEKKYGHGAIWVYAHYWLWLHYVFLKAKELIKEIKFDFAHHVSWGSIQQGTTLWRLGIPLVFGPTGGGQFAPDLLKPYFLEGWRTEQKRKLISNLLLIFNRNTKKTLQKSSLILVDNQDTKILVDKYDAQQAVLINDPNLSNKDLPETFPHRSPGGALRLIWVGRLLFRKGLPLVLEALAQVSSDIPIILSVYGDGPVGKYLPEMIKKLRLEERVVWKGQVPHSEVKEAYLQNDAFIFCPLRETLGEQFFEAMAYGLPIITLDLHGAKTAVPDEGGRKVPVLNENDMVNELADSIVFFYKHPAKREAMGKFNFSYIKEIATNNKAKLVREQLQLTGNLL
ncbi:glycosyltransferase family 4 protein [Catalinimonas sp. 4WD22]|uniref:glycosyltransferase family 4 protein n=1 Tax=Catalinimonas locisalis TaxID=3133978 RepID=UPI0031016392